MKNTPKKEKKFKFFEIGKQMNNFFKKCNNKRKDVLLDEALKL